MKTCPTSFSCVKIALVTVILWCKAVQEFLSLLSTFIIRYGAKFGMWYLYILLSIYELDENRSKEGRTFLVGVNEMSFTGVPRNRDILERKHALLSPYAILRIRLFAVLLSVGIIVTPIFFMAQQPLVGQAVIFEASRSHSDTWHGRIPLDEWSAQRRDFYLTTHNTPCPRRDSNPQFQQASGLRPTT